MFGVFRKKKFSFTCPMCEVVYHVKFDPDELTEYDYEYESRSKIVTKQKCTFCKVEITVVIFDSQLVKAFDDKWQKYYKEYEQKIDVLSEQIGTMEDIIEENPSDEKAKGKLARLQKQYDKIEDSYESKSEKYDERRYNWCDKRQDKYGD